MTNRILHVELRDRSVIPAEAEVHVAVFPERLDPRTEARGRLVGPRCRYATTVEVAYHLRPLLVPTGRPAIALRAIVPEASLWSPESPHLYQGPIELWQDGQRCDVVEVRHGLRYFSVGPRGLRVNGRQVTLRGRAVAGLDEDEAVALRAGGYNLVVVPATAEAEGAWEVADRVGLLVLGRVGPAATPDVIRRLSTHPSGLGYVLEEGVTLPAEAPTGALLGSEAVAPAGPVSFLVLPRGMAGQAPEGRPVLWVGAADGALPAGALGLVEVG